MKRSQVIEILSERRSELAHTYGVKSLALFGSVARGQSMSASAGKPQAAHPRACD
jgi:predicted nucleotidyltransferase